MTVLEPVEENTKEREKVEPVDKDTIEQMRAIAEKRVPNIGHLAWTLKHLIEHYQKERSAHYVVAVALDDYAQDTATITTRIRKQMSAYRAATGHWGDGIG